MSRRPKNPRPDRRRRTRPALDHFLFTCRVLGGEFEGRVREPGSPSAPLKVLISQGFQSQAHQQGGGGGEVQEQAVQGGSDVAGKFGGGGGRHGIGQDDSQEVAAEKEGQEQGRGGPEAPTDRQGGQEHRRPEEAEIIRLNQGQRQVRDGLDELLRIKALDMVGADWQVLLH